MLWGKVRKFMIICANFAKGYHDFMGLAVGHRTNLLLGENTL